jgi:Uma2 family endonuclease
VEEAPFFPTPNIELIETDGEPLETDWHRIEINLLIESVRCHLAGRTDYYAGGNMFIYFSEEHARNRDFRGPDFFLVWNVPSTPLRPYWAVWKEGGRYPDIIIELLSPTTAEIDRTTKKDLYERVFRTIEYYCYDPDTKQLEGWRLANSYYEPLAPSERGRLWCKQLGLWLGTWDGEYLDQQATWLRFFTPDGSAVSVFAEAERKLAEAERQRADAERQRADALEAEVARLRAQFESQHKPTKP